MLYTRVSMLFVGVIYVNVGFTRVSNLPGILIAFD